ncbi:MAG: DUF433 domain-containing protein [Saprospiraceae bacterium]|jgi:uncharacterized protein (DUF433 family)|nr:DUF433 domain-containing protein [Saprospiraceae bacterium]
MNFKYIVSDSNILGGKPIIKGSRVSVQLILEWIADGASIEDIHKEFPNLPVVGIREAILYASRFLDNEILIDVKPQVG